MSDKSVKNPEGKKENVRKSAVNLKTRKSRKRSGKYALQGRKLLKGIASGLSVSEAMRAAGYAESTISKNAKKTIGQNGVREKIAVIMDRLGLTDEAICETFREAMGANRVISAAGKEATGSTTDFVEVPDHGTRLKAASEVAKIKDLYPSQRVKLGGDEGAGPIKTESVMEIGPGVRQLLAEIPGFLSGGTAGESEEALP